MSWEFGDGFDFWSLTVDGEAPTNWFTASNQCTASATTTRFGVGRALNITINGNIWRYLSTDRTTIFFNFAFYAAQTLAPTFTVPVYCINLYDAANLQCSIAWLINGNMTVTTTANGGGVNLATFTGAYTAAQWIHYQIKAVINNTTGSVEVRKNGNTSDDFSATNINTRHGSTNNSINLFELINPSGLEKVIDDFYVFTGDDATAPADWQGDIRAFQILPNGNSSPLNWTPSTGTNWSSVAKAIPAATPNVSSNNPGDQDYYTVTPLPYLPESIVCVQSKCFAHKSDTNPYTIQLNTISVATEHSSPTLSLQTTNQWCLDPMTVDPATGIAWTPSGVNAAIVGPEVVSSP